MQASTNWKYIIWSLKYKNIVNDINTLRKSMEMSLSS